ncbi:hypothetical protein SAMN04489835_1945 [Mycolicibacterium rutilum]|uniref:Uncharacterized protein n=1 Tax=Mycolicibacterium rutilum TaxID=370526 RepID=A0A1H6JMR5_MYCRU|nr:hypothetical protein [Mycolicibacterium rutilum]SEH60585.1 hypothetical protein SAMN04489835_1945 [Mycolicibacterium rutilum]
MVRLNTRTARWLVVVVAVVGLVAACTTNREPDLPPSTDPAAIAERVTGPDGPAFLQDIVAASWDDGGARAGELFAWIPQDAHSEDSAAAIRAGETAHAIASFIADDKDALAGTPGNPGLWRSCARSLVPYIGAMAGDLQGVSGFEALDTSNTEMRRTAAVFAAFHKDPEASRIFTEAANERAHSFEVSFAEEAAANPTLVGNTAPLEDLMRAARLRGLLAAGAHIADPESPVATPMQAQTEVMYQVASRSVRPGDPYISPDFFRQGRLLSPNQINKGSWSAYDSQLTAYLAAFSTSVMRFASTAIGSPLSPVNEHRMRELHATLSV